MYQQGEGRVLPSAAPLYRLPAKVWLKSAPYLKGLEKDLQNKPPKISHRCALHSGIIVHSRYNQVDNRERPWQVPWPSPLCNGQAV